MICSIFIIIIYQFMSLPAIKKKSAQNHTKFKTSIEKQKKQIYQLNQKTQQIIRNHSNTKLVNSFLQYQNQSLLRSRIVTQISNSNFITGNFLEQSKILVVTAFRWVIYDRNTENYARGFKADQTQKMYGFSKLLVYYCVYIIASKYVIDITKFDCIGTVYAQLTAGIKGYLNRQDLITIECLLYLMILQQSDQCEYLLALNLGAFLYKKQRNEIFTVYEIKQKDEKLYLSTFILFLNTTCSILHLQKTKIKGFSEEQKLQNVSCCSDIAKLAIGCIKISWFQKMINTNIYKSLIKFVNQQGDIQTKQIKIQNHNSNTKNLPYKFIYKNNSYIFSQSSCCILYEDNLYSIVIVLMNCHSSYERSKDAQKTIEWFLKKKKEEQKYPKFQ